MHKNKGIYVFLLTSILFPFRAHLFASDPDAYKIATRVEELEKRGPSEIERPVIEYQSSRSKDPFILYVEEKKTAKTLDNPEVIVLPSDIVLRGIIWGGKLNQAIIKNKIVKVGDIIDGVSILDITKNWVSVFYRGRKFELSSPTLEKVSRLKKKAGGEDEK
ncbi:MAG: hypothetical protein NT033_01370 [Candidatus Omnitrophica bacterium]|nr:hypothetical protein [Candidatus Omnitrophota bacterium]